MFKELSQLIRDYAKNQSTDSVKRYYNDIADALDDEEFLQILSNTETLERLNSLQNNFYYSIRENVYHNVLNTIYTNYIIHRSESKQTISKFSQKVRDFEEKIKEYEESLEIIKEVAGDISGAEILKNYAKDFDEEAEEHKENSRKWPEKLVSSVIIFVAIVALLLFVQISNFSIIKDWIANDIKGLANLNTLMLVIKGSIIIAYVQIPLFIRKNYFAEKHLE